MRYERLAELLRIAIHLQGSRSGLTIADIQDEFSVSRRTAERMRDVVEAAFGPLETVDVDTGDRRIRWRLQSRTLYPLIRVSPEELAELEAAAGSLERTGLAERAGGLRDLAVKLRGRIAPSLSRRVRLRPGDPDGGRRTRHARRSERKPRKGSAFPRS